jgi:hypothetical protein
MDCYSLINRLHISQNTGYLKDNMEASTAG